MKHKKSKTSVLQAEHFHFKTFSLF